MNPPLFSVIIPHKDTPDLLIRAISTIPNNENIQIIVVDNSSSPLNISSLTSIRSNVSILYSDTKRGAGGARNIGIGHAQGKWLLFLDADDFFTPNAFDSFYSVVNSEHEIIYFKMTSCFSDTFEPAMRGDVYSLLVDNYIHKFKDATNKLRLSHVSPCAKMVLNAFVRREGIQFDEVPASNDVMFSTKTGFYAKSVSAKDEFVYCATISRGSLTNIKSLRVIESRYLVYLRRNYFLRERNKNKYQWSVMGFFFQAKKFGFIQVIRFFGLSIKYKNNIFIGFQNWFKSYISLKNKNIKLKDYITNN